MAQKFSIATLLVITIIVVPVLAFNPIRNPPQKKTRSDSSFAVVELFTSEGCSSCPPADRLLGEIAKRTRSQDKRVFALAFHVDYWNNLGWKDIYSKAAFSRRQRNYARALQSNRVYTPEMVINGASGFVGSNRPKAQHKIRQALSKPAQVTVDITNIRITDDHIVHLQYRLNQLADQAVLNLAVVERGIVRHIKRGENAGLTMHHENVVRSFETKDLNHATGSATLSLPSNLQLQKSSVVAYVQNKQTMKVLGAEGKVLPFNQ